MLITGGCGGIGAATAGRFVRDGARVVVLDNDSEACDRVQRELPGLLGTLVADVTDPDSVQSAFHQLDDLCQGVDILINNASGGGGGQTDEKFVRLPHTNSFFY